MIDSVRCPFEERKKYVGRGRTCRPPMPARARSLCPMRSMGSMGSMGQWARGSLGPVATRPAAALEQMAPIRTHPVSFN
ncbi:unnamed protein product, partial [Iphiclides podalirius]